MPSHLRQEVAQPRRAAGRVRCERVLDPATRQQAVLDHQELMGTQMGRTRLLSPLSGPRHVWNEHHGLWCHGGSNPNTS